MKEVDDAAAAEVDVNKALLELMVQAYGRPELVDGISQANDKLRISRLTLQKMPKAS